VAQPTTITGSIGVVTGKLSVRGLFQRLGLNPEIVARGEAATMDSPLAPYTPGQLERVRRQAQAIYRQFVERVAVGRGRSPGEVDAVGRGRVWTGRQALERGLVDELGDFALAVRRAAALAGVPPDHPVEAITIHPPRATGIPAAAGLREALEAAWSLAREPALLLVADPLDLLEA
jgi:protease-4